jgi:hypothetical protein
MRTVLLLLALWLSAPAAAAELVLIANPKSGITQLGKDDVVNIYLGRYRRLPSGLTAEPVDQPADSELRARFYRQLVGKSMTEINAYWARLVFSGKTQPPQVADSASDAIRLVARQPTALAYVERTQVDSRVVVVFDWRNE